MNPHRHVGPESDDCLTCSLPRRNRHHVGAEPVIRPGALTPLADIAPAVGQQHPETSHAAAAATLPGYATRLYAILSLVIAAGEYGRTDDELELESGWTHQTVSAARNRLVAGGWLIHQFDGGRTVTRPTRSGRSATVWTATAAALAAHPKGTAG